MKFACLAPTTCALQSDTGVSLHAHRTRYHPQAAGDRTPLGYRTGQGTFLITQHGLPSAYLVDVETYQLMQQRMAVMEGIARGELAIAEGRVATHAQAKTRLARWLK